MSLLRRSAWALTVLGLGTGPGGILLGCGASALDRDPQASAFAEIDLAYEGCSCFEEVRELKVISRRLFGVLPDVDEERQIVRIRLRDPRILPLAEFARAVDGTHAVTRSLTLEAVVSLQEGRAMIQPTGQALPLGEFAGGEAGHSRRRLKGSGWSDPSQFRMSLLP